MDKAKHTFQKNAVSGKFIIKGINRAQIRILQAREAGASAEEIGILQLRYRKLSDAFSARVTRYTDVAANARKAELETSNQVSVATLRALKGEGPIGKA